MKKRILSVMSSLIMAGCILGTSSVAVNAQENEKIVDGSVLTTDDTSTGRTENGLERGIHLMDGPFPKQESQECTAMDQQQRTMKWINLQ